MKPISRRKSSLVFTITHPKSRHKSMEDHRNLLQGHHSKSIQELKQTLLYTAMELETTRIAAHEELKRRDSQIAILNELLNRAIKERDEALQNSQKLHLENHLLKRCAQPPRTGGGSGGGDPLSGVSSADEELDTVRGTEQLTPGCEESIASPAAEEESEAVLLLPRNPLPEKGKLLQAVMKAGPLLETLLLAGPMPQWRHPPPALEAFEIPPVGIGCCESSGSGVAGDGSLATRPYKYQRIAS